MSSSLQTNSLSPAYTREDLTIYWSTEFPFELLSEWWKKSGELNRRDFSVYAIYDSAKMIRYLRITNKDDWLKIVRTHTPIRLDVGSCYNKPPTSQYMRDEAQKKEKERIEKELTAEQKQYMAPVVVENPVPVSRELVFDIDISDYFPVDGEWKRTCCVKGLCQKCWVFLACAAEIMTYLLHNILGFSHIIVIFSGKKGIHLWVMDRGLETMTQEQRQSILTFMELYDVDADIECMQIVKRYIKLLVERDILQPPLSQDDWKNGKHLLFPRLDKKVTHDPSHLIKCPFSLHPDTGKITLALRPSSLSYFVPEDSPTLHQVIHESAGRKQLHDSIRYFRDVYEKSISD